MGETWLLQPLLVIATEALTHFFLLVGLQRMHAVVLFHKGLGSAVQALHCKVSSAFQHNALFHTELKNGIFFWQKLARCSKSGHRKRNSEISDEQGEVECLTDFAGSMGAICRVAKASIKSREIEPQSEEF